MKLKHLIRFLTTYFATLGIVWLFITIVDAGFNKSYASEFWIIIGGNLILSAGVFLFDGCFITGFLLRKITIFSNAFDTEINICFGDIFVQSGYRAIPVNEYFDSLVDERHVSSKSLHGITLAKYWGGNTGEWDQAVSNSLRDVASVETIDRDTGGKEDKYAIGTTAVVQKNDQNFLFFALSHTDIQTFKASATPPDLLLALKGLLQKAREVCSGQPLVIPLVGSGLSGTGVKRNILIDLILLAIFEESRESKITDEIKIILPNELRGVIDLSTVKKDWGLHNGQQDRNLCGI